MDSQGFRLPPEGYSDPTTYAVYEAAHEEVIHGGYSVPADDARYPAFAATMADGRTFTDYRSKCQERVSADLVNPVKQWLIHNTDDLLTTMRKRQAENTGAIYGTQKTYPDAEMVQTCNPLGCEIQRTGNAMGTGIERKEAFSVELANTFDFSASPMEMLENTKKVAINDTMEGGRNSVHRWEKTAGAFGL